MKPRATFKVGVVKMVDSLATKTICVSVCGRVSTTEL